MLATEQAKGRAYADNSSRGRTGFEAHRAGRGRSGEGAASGVWPTCDSGFQRFFFGSLGVFPAFLRVEVSFEQWNAERIAPKLYGNRVKTEVTGKDGAPMQLQTQVQVIDSRMLDPEQRDALRQILLAAANEGEQTDE